MKKKTHCLLDIETAAAFIIKDQYLNTSSVYLLNKAFNNYISFCCFSTKNFFKQKVDGFI